MHTIFSHPRRKLVHVMDRIYRGHMTTTSGGNLSLREPNGDIWITPAGVDKGTLSESDIVLVRADGRVEGRHRPSSELPFHRAIYQRRPDLFGIVHAHPPSLVAFSIVRQIPDTRILPQARAWCGKTGYAPFRLPGSEALGESIAEAFARGHHGIIMENHGVVVGGPDLMDAFYRFETLEFTSRTLINSKRLGEPRYLTVSDIDRFEARSGQAMEAMDEAVHPADELDLRQQMADLVERACRQQLMISTYGTLSARWRGNDFLITPTMKDRALLGPEDMVQIRDGRHEAGKVPSRAAPLHQRIYQALPKVHSILITQPPHLAAFCVAHTALDTRTIPESYVVLRDIPLLPFGAQLDRGDGLLASLSEEQPLALVANDAVVVTAGSLLEAFDRLEVAEFSARSLIMSRALGELVPIGAEALEDLRAKYFS